MEVVNAFKIIFKEGRKPKLIRTDKGKEFTGSIVEKYFKKLDIHHFVTQNEGKASYAECAIKTIKNSICQYGVTLTYLKPVSYFRLWWWC